MRHLTRASLAGLLGLATALLVACGGSGSGLLSGSQADSLNSRLDAISSAVAAGHCGGASQAVSAFQDEVSRLPSTVSPTLRANLSQGASTVAQLAARDCAAQTTQTTATTTTETTSTSTTSTSTPTATSTATATAPPPTTPATTPTSPGNTGSPGSGGAGIGGGNTTTSGPSSGGAGAGGK